MLFLLTRSLSMDGFGRKLKFEAIRVHLTYRDQLKLMLYLCKVLTKAFSHHHSNYCSDNGASYKIWKPVNVYRYSESNVKRINKREISYNLIFWIQHQQRYRHSKSNSGVRGWPAGAADKAASLAGWKSLCRQLLVRTASIFEACGGNEAWSART